MFTPVVFYIFRSLFVTLPCYLGFSNQSPLLLQFLGFSDQSCLLWYFLWILLISFKYFVKCFFILFVLSLLLFLRFLGFSDESFLVLTFLPILFISFSIFYVILIKVTCFYLFVPILLISFTIISSVFTFFVINLLLFSQFLGFSNESCFFYLFWRFSWSLLRFVFSCVFLHFSFSVCYLPCYVGFSDQSRLLLSFFPILFISFTIIVFSVYHIFLLRFSHFLSFFDQSCLLSSFLPIILISFKYFVKCFLSFSFSVCYVFRIF